MDGSQQIQTLAHLVSGVQGRAEGQKLLAHSQGRLSLTQVQECPPLFVERPGQNILGLARPGGFFRLPGGFQGRFVIPLEILG